MLKSLDVSKVVDEESENVSKLQVLWDGGASHNVFYSSSIPQGAVKREVDLAHGTKIGYVKDGDITLIDESVTAERARVPTIISLGRLVQHGALIEWSKEGVSLTLPDKKRLVCR